MITSNQNLNSIDGRTVVFQISSIAPVDSRPGLFYSNPIQSGGKKEQEATSGTERPSLNRWYTTVVLSYKKNNNIWNELSALDDNQASYLPLGKYL